ncbi:adhesion G protein-coupled receptor G3 isoform X3 [Gadus chalcogrammus]|uniref:adhesion G protein-coupled receptor G3 isoform X3 n=1 Tax=Gadus chalcogrammus TaxID=1042646 RepID=UPI0024C4E51A|nr:adhesion G protein-coupled receptor G3 isoform X3 [Gadus chalcogrammus]
MIYVVTRKPREEPSIFIHVSLSGALFLLNSSFLLTEWGARWNPGWVCELIAALVHYSLLGSFSWMAVEGLHLYLMLIKVFNTEYKHYQLKLSLFGWGIPAVVVGVTWSLKDVKQIYGSSTLTMLDSNQTTSICWISDITYLYATNVVYFSLVFIFNSGILLIVAVRICCMVTTPARKGLGWRTATTVAGITCLLGVTWGLAFLGSGYVNLPILYLFCILNSTQGAFIFFWILGLARIERKRALEAKNASVSINDSKVTSVK